MTDVLSIKAAFKKLVKACGGREACALVDGMPKGKRPQAFTDYGNPNHPDMPPLYMIPLLEEYCGQPHVTLDLARATGHELVKLLPATPSSNDIAGFCTLIQEFGEVTASWAEARADGVITAVERPHVRQQLKELILAATAVERWLAVEDAAGEDH